MRLLRREVELRGLVRAIWMMGTTVFGSLWVGGDLGPLESPLELVDSRNPLVELLGALLLTVAGMAVPSFLLLVVTFETARRIRTRSGR
jgi:hypothetical protein